MNSGVSEADARWKVCPFCAERIREAALKCRYCGERLETITPSAQDEGCAAAVDVSKPSPLPPQKVTEDALPWSRAFGDAGAIGVILRVGLVVGITAAAATQLGNREKRGEFSRYRAEQGKLEKLAEWERQFDGREEQVAVVGGMFGPTILKFIPRSEVEKEKSRGSRRGASAHDDLPVAMGGGQIVDGFLEYGQLAEEIKSTKRAITQMDAGEAERFTNALGLLAVGLIAAGLNFRTLRVSREHPKRKLIAQRALAVVTVLGAVASSVWVPMLLVDGYVVPDHVGAGLIVVPAVFFASGVRLLRSAPLPMAFAE